MANIILVICGIIILGAAWRGYRTGCIRMVLSLASILFTMLLVEWFSPWVNDMIRNYTPMQDMIYETVYDNLEENISDLFVNKNDKTKKEIKEEADEWLKNAELDLDEQIQWLKSSHIPEKLQKSVLKKEKVAAKTVIKKASRSISSITVDIISYVITFLGIFALVQILIIAFGIVGKLPVLNELNQGAGAVIGLIEGIIIIWLLALLVTIFGQTFWGGAIIQGIEGSRILSWLYSLFVFSYV